MSDGLEDFENLVAPSSAQLSHLLLILSLIFMLYIILFKIMYQASNLMLFQPSYPRSQYHVEHQRSDKFEIPNNEPALSSQLIKNLNIRPFPHP